MKPPKWDCEQEIAAATSQFSIRFGPPTTSPTSPEQWIAPETVPSTFRFRIVAPETRKNGAIALSEPDRATVSVFDPPSKVPRKGLLWVPTVLTMGPMLAQRR